MDFLFIAPFKNVLVKNSSYIHSAVTNPGGYLIGNGVIVVEKCKQHALAVVELESLDIFCCTSQDGISISPCRHALARELAYAYSPGTNGAGTADRPRVRGDLKSKCHPQYLNFAS